MSELPAACLRSRSFPGSMACEALRTELRLAKSWRTRLREIRKPCAARQSSAALACLFRPFLSTWKEETLDDFLEGFPTVASVTCCRLFRREDSIALDQKRRGTDDLPVGALAKVDPLPSCRREVDLRKRKRLTISTGSCQWNETRSALRIRGLLRPHWRWIRHLRPTIAGTMNAFKASNCCRFNISMNVDLR